MLRALGAALGGLAANQRLLEDSARRIARVGRPPPAEPVDLPAATAQLIVARRGYQANLQTIKVTDEMLGSLLDVLA
jgi:flagellar basal body rod protein FlgG